MKYDAVLQHRLRERIAHESNLLIMTSDEVDVSTFLSGTMLALIVDNTIDIFNCAYARGKISVVSL